jgi:hypothetical protein
LHIADPANAGHRACLRGPRTNPAVLRKPARRKALQASAKVFGMASRKISNLLNNIHICIFYIARRSSA